MYVYSLGQWLLFFFLYCFLGWVWESCYVSAKRRQWVNRGFLHGPMLPIYGKMCIRDSILSADRMSLCEEAPHEAETFRLH